MSKRREFSKKIKETAWDRANGKCESCGFPLTIGRRNDGSWRLCPHPYRITRGQP